MKASKNPLVIFSRLIRLPDLIIIALSQYLVRFCIFQPIFHSRGIGLQMGQLDFALLVLSTLLIAAGGYVINDYFDLRIDEVNRPEKMVLQKHLSLRSANNLYYVLTIAGCIAGIFVAYQVGSIKLGFIQLVSATMLYYYSLKYKRIAFAGNFTVAILAALSILIVWLFEFFAMKQNPLVFGEIAGYFKTVNTLVLGYAFFAFWITLIREMVKDIEDLRGDKAFRCRTLPIIYGVRKMHTVILILSLVTIPLLGYFTYRLFSFGFNLSGWYFAIATGGLWVYYLTCLVKTKNEKDYHFLSTLLKVMMIAGILSMQLLFASF